MNSRTARSTVTFTYPFRIAGYEDDLPAGDYQIDVDEELLEGLSLEAYRRMGTYLLIRSRASGGGCAEMRPIDPRDLEAALARDRAQSEQPKPGDAALSAQEYPS